EGANSNEAKGMWFGPRL
uniref:Pyrokinin-5 n=1 Tax=Archimandrita tessellata TaxID=36945 RepID=PPK5_ARCTE|nr:RecName: Full=Pyrokinin-5; AltName: Full=ArcTe-Capa-PK; AltName: Full=FXPRL-amide [Archimandrita tessellata]